MNILKIYVREGIDPDDFGSVVQSSFPFTDNDVYQGVVDELQIVEVLLDGDLVPSQIRWLNSQPDVRRYTATPAQ